MKYTNEIIINAPREEVIEKFDNPKNLKKWQPGFIAFEVIEGKNGEVGSKHRLTYKAGKRDIELIETVTERNLPDTFSGTYETKNMWNEVKNHFEDTGDGKTRYWTESEFKMSGTMKIFGWFMPGAFKKQSQQYLVKFKNFVESEPSSAN